jgi:hypothetical protein
MPTLLYDGIETQTSGVWQHIVCMYSENTNIMGIYSPHDLDTHFVYTQQVQETEATPIPAGAYMVTLGNNYHRT